jgi:hypothetical protein
MQLQSPQRGQLFERLTRFLRLLHSVTVLMAPNGEPLSMDVFRGNSVGGAPGVQAASKCINKKPALCDQAVQGGKRFMPLGVRCPHDLSQAGDVRS